MAAKKFLRLVSGRIKEIAGIVTSAGAGNDGDFPVLDSTGRLDISMMPVGVIAETKVVLASENLAAGDFINFWNSSGTCKARKADATDPTKYGEGFVLSAVTSGQNATCYLEGINTQVSGCTPGARQYLSQTTPGGVTETPPSTAGQIVQCLGQAVSATEIGFEPAEPVELA